MLESCKTLDLPCQLQRVPITSLVGIRDSLKLLIDIGVTAVANIEDFVGNLTLLAAPGLRRGTRELIDGLTTSSMAMSEWTWRPSNWRSTEHLNPATFCTLAGMMQKTVEHTGAWQGRFLETTQEAYEAARKEALAKLSNVADDGLTKRVKLAKKRGVLEGWLKAMLIAHEDLRVWGEIEDDLLPKCYGESFCPLFGQVNFSPNSSNGVVESTFDTAKVGSKGQVIIIEDKTIKLRLC